MSGETLILMIRKNISHSFYLVGGGGVPVQGVLPHCLTVTMGAGVLTIDEATGRGTNGVGLWTGLCGLVKVDCGLVKVGCGLSI